MASRLQCGVALFLMATFFIVITDAARVLNDGASVGVDVYSSNAKSPPTVDLGTAEQFSVLAHSTITNTGGTTIGGFLGVSPGKAVAGESYITYSEQPTPNGRVSTEDAAIANANVTSAYLDIESRTEDVVIINVVNIGGLTFSPGLYKTSDSLAVSSGTVYLKGDADGVFIFQIAQELKMSTGLKMVLQGGAQAKNVFWQVGTSATFNVGSEAVGTIMAHAAITSQTGCKFNGRLFALNEAVTFDSTTVVFPM